MKRILLVVCLAFALNKASLAEVYKWVDERGVTHYGDLVPDKYADKKKAAAVTSPSPVPSEHGAALERLEKQKRLADKFQKSREEEQRARDKKLAELESEDLRGPPKDETPCEKEWRDYYESKDCFDKYRWRNRSAAEALKNCKEVVRPFGCIK